MEIYNISIQCFYYEKGIVFGFTYKGKKMEKINIKQDFILKQKMLSNGKSILKIILLFNIKYLHAY